MSSFKKKLYDGDEIIINEKDDDMMDIFFIEKGVILVFDTESWEAVKKELIEALG